MLSFTSELGPYMTLNFVLFGAKLVPLLMSTVDIDSKGIESKSNFSCFDTFCVFLLNLPLVALIVWK